MKRKNFEHANTKARPTANRSGFLERFKRQINFMRNRSSMPKYFCCFQLQLELIHPEYQRERLRIAWGTCSPLVCV